MKSLSVQQELNIISYVTKFQTDQMRQLTEFKITSYWTLKDPF